MTTPFRATPIRVHSNGAARRGHRTGFDLCRVHQMQTPVSGSEPPFAARADMWRPRGRRTITTEKPPW
jgi:hypothetical protein